MFHYLLKKKLKKLHWLALSKFYIEFMNMYGSIKKTYIFRHSICIVHNIPHNLHHHKMLIFGWLSYFITNILQNIISFGPVHITTISGAE